MKLSKNILIFVNENQPPELMENNTSYISQITGSKSDENILVPSTKKKDMVGDSTERLQVDTNNKRSLLHKTKQAVYTWAENTTLHGMRFVFDTRSSKIRRLIWLLLISGMWIGQIWSCVSQYNRYFEYETVTQDTFRLENQLAFPAVTICNMCHTYNVSGRYEDYELILKFSSVETREDLEKLKELYKPRINDNTTLAELFERLSTPADVFFRLCLWNFEIVNCSAYWKAMVYSRFPCFTFDSEKDGGPLLTKNIGRYSDGLSMTLFLGQDSCLFSHGNGIIMAIHEAGVEPNIFVSMTLAPGLHHNIGVTVNERTFLPPPVKAFSTSSCLDTEASDFTNPLKYYSSYSLSSCEQECFSEYVNETCGCIVTRRPEQFKTCDVITLRTCATPSSLKFWDNYNINVERCGCLQRCKYTTYTTSVSSSNLVRNMIYNKPENVSDEQMADKEYIRENFLSFDVFLDSKVIHVTKQIRAFTIGDFGASIGGFFGLAIGASILTFCEIFDLIFTQVFSFLSGLGRAR